MNHVFFHGEDFLRVSTKSFFKFVGLAFQRNAVVASVIQKTSNVSVRKARQSQYLILHSVDEFMK